MIFIVNTDENRHREKALKTSFSTPFLCVILQNKIIQNIPAHYKLNISLFHHMFDTSLLPNPD